MVLAWIESALTLLVFADWVSFIYFSLRFFSFLFVSFLFVSFCCRLARGRAKSKFGGMLMPQIAVNLVL